MKKKVVTNEDEELTNPLDKRKGKNQSDFMKQLTDIAQQVVEQAPSPPQIIELPTEETAKVQVERDLSSMSQAGSRLARPTPLRRPPAPVKPVATPSKPARIPVKVIPIPTVASDSTQTIETVREKTPKQFSSAFLRFIDKLKELNWFEEQYPMVKIEVS